MAYNMSQRLVGVEIGGHLPTKPGFAHCACACPRAFALPQNIDRTPLQAEPFVAESTGDGNLGVSFALVSIFTLSEPLRSASPGSLGLRLATG